MCKVEEKDIQWFTWCRSGEDGDYKVQERTRGHTGHESSMRSHATCRPVNSKSRQQACSNGGDAGVQSFEIVRLVARWEGKMHADTASEARLRIG